MLKDAGQAVKHGGCERHLNAPGDIAVFSLNGEKALVAGEGGVLVTAERQLFEKLRAFAHGGRSAHNPFIHDSLGIRIRNTPVFRPPDG